MHNFLLVIRYLPARTSARGVLNEWDRLCQGRPPVLGSCAGPGLAGESISHPDQEEHELSSDLSPSGVVTWRAWRREVGADALKKETDTWNTSLTF